MNDTPHLVIVAGEDSGDFHGANLAKALQRQLPALRLSGIGGEKMAAAGVELVFASSRLAVVGIVEVVNRVPEILRGLKSIRRHLRRERPDLLVLIDFPDFNLNLVAPYARRLGIPIVYYISPQVWAWRRRRVRTISRLVKKILVILPFEEEFYRRHGVTAEYVGHPLLDEFRSFKPGPRDQPLIALIPGSRKGEIRRMLPLMLTTARLYQRRRPESRFLIPVAPSVAPAFIEEFIPDSFRGFVTVRKQPLSRALEDVVFALVTSGTATLETALAEVPMVVLYKVNPFSYELGKRLISVPFISLVNLIAGCQVVPELIQNEALPEKVSAALRSGLDDADNYARTLEGLRRLKKKLG
ncbi:MAG: lipid-A-disaccharide synthase, partial [Deltaproteobacteria bacterium]|nr:lipid-A-disaccharide synthase [Deltaproteobacteria bacterium]